MERRTIRFFGGTTGAAAATIAVVLASCSNAGTAAAEPRQADSGTSGDMVIEVSSGGGLAPPAVRVSDSLPRIWIGGDGRYLRQTSKSGSPAVIALEERRIPDAALAGLIQDARAAGLLDVDPDYGDPPVADAMVTRVVVVTGGTRHTVLISALGYPGLDLPEDAVSARTRLTKFLDTLEHPERMAGASGPSDYAPAEMAVFVLGSAASSIQTTPAPWPLGDLGTAGVATDWPDRSARCLVITGSQIAAVVSAAAGNDRFAPWRSEDGLWDLALRPLLPDEHSCADVLG
ncbi:MAG: hypothetical protein KIH64_002835 [Mycobacterium sp.]|nr:hypothetical protein [Mycobacterium sp.]